MMKTGDIIKIGKKEMDVIDTFIDEKEQLELMLSVLMRRQHSTERKFWDTIKGLYPETKGYNLHANWEKKEITLRGKVKR